MVERLPRALRARQINRRGSPISGLRRADRAKPLAARCDHGPNLWPICW